MEEEKPKLKGREFLNAVTTRLMQTSGNPPPPTTEDEVKEYEQKRRTAEAKSQYYDTVDKLNNPPSVQEIHARERERMETERSEAAARARDFEQRERDRLEKESAAASEHAAIEQQKREDVQHQLQEQRDQMLLDKLQELKSSQKPLDQQIDEYFQFAEKAAVKMGFEKPSARASEDPRIALEIAKLELEKAREQRDFEWRMEQDRRKWDMELQKLNDEREYRRQQMQIQEKKDDLFFNAPKIFGSVVAKGLLDGMQDQENGRIASSGKPQGKPFNITVADGAEGQINCPECESKVPLGPTTKRAICVNCQSVFNIGRQATEAAPPPDHNEDEEE